MRTFIASAGAALVILAAGPVLAGGPTGGGHHPRPAPPPGPCCGHPGGGNVNINVNANAHASAQAFAGASARSWLNARTYSAGAVRGGTGGGVVYVGGGYGGDVGGYYGAPVYNEIAWDGHACASAPFGYLVNGFGRVERIAPSCGRADVYYEDEDRGGRYGYSERHDRYDARSYESYEAYSAYESSEIYGEYADYADYEDDAGYEDRARRDDRDEFHGSRVSDYDRGYMDGRRDCDCRPDGRDGEPYYPPVPPPPPVYQAPPPSSTERPYRPEPPRQIYRQEPGERG